MQFWGTFSHFYKKKAILATSIGFRHGMYEIQIEQRPFLVKMSQKQLRSAVLEITDLG